MERKAGSRIIIPIFGRNRRLWATLETVIPYGHFGRWAAFGATRRFLGDAFHFGRDLDYLRSYAYPIMKKAAIFCLDWLHEDSDGALITSPSTSPEQKFVIDGERFAVSKSATMDTSLIWELLTNCIEASELLAADDSLREK